jgi:uncharacterized glyoxalase superfamily metalloenzyme YdcJ
MSIDLKDIFTIEGSFNEKVYQKLLEAIKSKATSDMDYIKFKKSYSSLCALGMDEFTAAKSAFVTAETMGFSKEKLVQSVNYYQQVLKKEKEAFALALKNQITNHVESKQLEADRLQQKKLENITKIEKLKEELLLIESKLKEMDNDIESTSLRIEDTRQQFVHTYSLLEKELDNDLELFNRIV